MRIKTLGLLLLVTLLGPSGGCGTVVYENTIEVILDDPTQRLGRPPFEVSVFDHQMGYGGEWARKTMGTTTGESPYTRILSTTGTTTVFGPSRPEEVRFGVAVPGLEPRGYFLVLVKPRAAPSGQQLAPFCQFGTSFPDPGAPTVRIEYTARPETNGWHVVLRLVVPPKTAASADAVPSTDPPSEPGSPIPRRHGAALLATVSDLHPWV